MPTTCGRSEPLSEDTRDRPRASPVVSHTRPHQTSPGRSRLHQSTHRCLASRVSRLNIAHFLKQLSASSRLPQRRVHNWGLRETPYYRGINIVGFFCGELRMNKNAMRLVTAESSDELVAYCPRPKCRKEVRQSVGRGRPRSYCSEECRRLTEAELKALQLKLRHYAQVVEQVRLDIAGYQRAGTVDASDPSALVHQAEVAMARAETALAFLEGDDSPSTHALRGLYQAVLPIVQAAPAQQVG